MKQFHEIPHLRGFKVKFICPTNNRGARVKITDIHNNVSIIQSYNYSDGASEGQAFNHLQSLGIEVSSFSVNDKTGESLLLSDNFDIKLKP